MVFFHTITTQLAASLYFSIFCFDKPIFSSYAESWFFSLKMYKITTRLRVTRWNIQNPVLKKDILCSFLESAP